MQNLLANFIGVFFKVRDDWAFQVNPLCRHDITSPFPPSGGRNLDVHAFMTSRLDCCNSLLGGCPASSIDKLQMYKMLLLESLPGARFNKEVQPTLSLNLNSELSYSEMGNSEFSVTEQLNCVSLLNSK